MNLSCLWILSPSTKASYSHTVCQTVGGHHTVCQTEGVVIPYILQTLLL